MLVRPLPQTTCEFKALSGLLPTEFGRAVRRSALRCEPTVQLAENVRVLRAWSKLLPPEQRALYLQIAEDILRKQPRDEAVRQARNEMVIGLVASAISTRISSREYVEPRPAIVAGVIMGALFVLSAIASVVQIVAAGMPLWLVGLVWVIVVVGGGVAGLRRWRQLQADGWTSDTAPED